MMIDNMVHKDTKETFENIATVFPLLKREIFWYLFETLQLGFQKIPFVCKINWRFTLRKQAMPGPKLSRETKGVPENSTHVLKRKLGLRPEIVSDYECKKAGKREKSKA